MPVASAKQQAANTKAHPSTHTKARSHIPTHHASAHLYVCHFARVSSHHKQQVFQIQQAAWVQILFLLCTGSCGVGQCAQCCCRHGCVHSQTIKSKATPKPQTAQPLPNQRSPVCVPLCEGPAVQQTAGLPDPSPSSALRLRLWHLAVRALLLLPWLHEQSLSQIAPQCLLLGPQFPASNMQHSQRQFRFPASTLLCLYHKLHHLVFHQVHSLLQAYSAAQPVTRGSQGSGNDRQAKT